MPRLSRLVPLLALVALVVTTAGTAVHAAVFVPSKLADSADGSCDTDCSLREAVQAANAQAGEDVILLAAGTYTLTLAGNEGAAVAGDLDVLDDLALLGKGAVDTVIDGGNLDRILDVAAGAALDLRDVTLTHGRATDSGGAVRNQGHLVIRRSLVTANATAAGSGGAGGGIYSGGAGSELAIEASTVSANTAAGVGGGIALQGIGELVNVTVADNAGNEGGGIYVFASSVATIGNATIAGNQATRGAGIFAESAAFTGIAPRVSNSILAGNVATISGSDCFGSLETAYVLVGNPQGCFGLSAAHHDLFPANAQLGPLQQAGGPTPTMPLPAGSPAIDAGTGTGDDACAATDQRGAARPAGAACDLGAFEVTTACVAGGDTLCLAGGRFAVRATFETPAGASGKAQAVGLTGDSGYFWFFDRGNVELTVKLLNGCGFNNRYWVFASGMTNVEVALTVTDTQSQVSKTYNNPLNRVYRTILDTNAFASCP
jgi:CSLREA domain-containing protein